MEIKHQHQHIEQSDDFELLTDRIGVDQGVSGKQDKFEGDASVNVVDGKLREESVHAAVNEGQIFLELKDEKEESLNVETVDKDVDFEVISGTIEIVDGPHMLDNSDLKYVEGQPFSVKNQGQTAQSPRQEAESEMQDKVEGDEISKETEDNSDDLIEDSRYAAAEKEGSPSVLDLQDKKKTLEVDINLNSTDKLKIEESEASTLQVDEDGDFRKETVKKNEDIGALVDDKSKTKGENGEGLRDLASIDENEDSFNEKNIDSFPDHSSKSLILDDAPILEQDSIILRSLGVKNMSVRDNPKLSPFTKNIKKKSQKKVLPETTPAPNYYLDYSAYSDYYNDPVEEPEHDTQELPTDVYRFRDYPMEDGYVRIPVFIPGLEMAGVSEVPKLWNAQDAFMRQVGSKLYMFIPSAILGFIIGLLVWITALVILRTFGVIKKAALKVFNNEKSDELGLKVKYVTTGDPWIKISDAEKIHSVNGAIRKSVIGPCSPEKIKEFNQQVLETVNLMRSPGSKEVLGLENEDDGEFMGMVGYVEEGEEYLGSKRRFSH